MSKPFNHGVWCCRKREKCKWQGFTLKGGLAWGSVPTHTPWRKYHDEKCGGELIQLIEKSK